MIEHALNDELSDYDLDKIKQYFKEIWHDYEDGGYDGRGNMLAIDYENRLYLFDLGHCSCDGPTNDIGLNSTSYGSLQELLSKCSEGYKKELEPVIEAYRKRFK